MPTEIRQRARQHDESDAVHAWPGSRTQSVEYSERQPVRRRPFRSVFRFMVAVVFGVGLTLAWQSYGNEALSTLRLHAPSIAWLLPVPKTKTLLNIQMSATETAIEVKKQLEPVAAKLEIVQHSLDQLAVKIKELAANQVTNNMQAVGGDVNRTMSSSPPSTNAAPAPERRTNPGNLDAAASMGAPLNNSAAPEADQPTSGKCDLDACKKAYFTFNPTDCTYQPLEGPRRICAK